MPKKKKAAPKLQPARAKTPVAKTSPKKIEMNAFLACDYAGRIQSEVNDTTKVSLQGIFDEVYAPSLPVLYSQFFLYLKVIGDNEQFQIEIAFTDPKGGRLVLAQGQLGINEGRAELVLGVPNFPLLHYGKYEFDVTADGKPIGWKLPIAVLEPKG